MGRQTFLFRDPPPGKLALSPGAHRIVDAAVAQFARRGFHGVSLREIAAEAAVDAALIVRHFGSKLGIWQAAVDHVATVLEAALSGSSGFSRAAMFEDRNDLTAMIEALVDVVYANPVVAQFIVKELVQQDDRFDYIWTRLVQPIAEYLVPLIASNPLTSNAPAPEIQFFALAGALATSVAARPYLTNMVPAVAEDMTFRAELKRILTQRFLPLTSNGYSHAS